MISLYVTVMHRTVDGGLDFGFEYRQESEAEYDLRILFSKIEVEVDEIKAEDNFKLDLGMSSFDTMCLVNDILDTFGVELKAADFVNYKTVGEMAEYLDSIC